MRRLLTIGAALFLAGLLGAAPAQATGLKSPMRGLLSRSGPPPSAYLDASGGWVVNVHWADLQATQDAPIAANNAIDQAIAQFDSMHLNGNQGLKIRLFAGIWAPDWAKNLGGAPIPVTDPTDGVSGTIGRFWRGDYGQAYQSLQNKLAAKYDGAPEIREITISRCTTVYVEPFIRDTRDAQTVQNLLAAGYTEALDQNCQSAEVNQHAVWTQTRSDLSFNPYQVINQDGSTGTDEAYTESMMSTCRSSLGSRCVLENNSLRQPEQYPAMYDKMQQLGPPIAFQTATLAKVGDLGATLDDAISRGANSVELPSGGFDNLGHSAAVSYNNRLTANPTS